MTKPAAKIVKVQITTYRRGGWPGYKVREITERGAVKNSYELSGGYDRAMATARASCRTHGILYSAIEVV